MQLRIVRETGYLRAELRGRETPGQMREALSAIADACQERGVVDKSHFAHAFGRALDTLAPEHRGGMIEHVLQNLRDRCMNLPPRGESDAREWLDRLLRSGSGP